MTTETPRVALAVPVYNGARYLPEALAALRAQTETRWVAVVTDNASTDGTAEIVRRDAMADPRIRYHCNATNLGANGNFNRSMALAVATGAPAVTWAAHDDRPRPDYLARCLDALDAHPEAVGAHSAIALVDDGGRPYPHDADAGGFHDGDGVWAWTRATQSAFADPDPGRRLSRFLHDKAGQWLVYGVWRADAVARTRPLAMPGVEDAWCAEVLLRGPVAFVDEVLFEQRHHAASARHLSRRDYIAYETGVRPTGLVLPSAGRAVAFARAIQRAPLDARGRRAAWRALGQFALGGDRLRNVFVPGPDNYFGLGAG